MLIEVCDGSEGSADTQNLHDGYAGIPLVSDGDDNQLFRYDSQSQHGGKRDKSGETQHFAKYPFLPFKVVGHFGEYRLRYSVYHAGDEELAHAAPFIGLVVISYFFFAVEFTQYHGKQIVIDVIEYIGNQ